MELAFLLRLDDWRGEKAACLRKCSLQRKWDVLLPRTQRDGGVKRILIRLGAA